METSERSVLLPRTVATVIDAALFVAYYFVVALLLSIFLPAFERAYALSVGTQVIVSWIVLVVPPLVYHFLTCWIGFGTPGMSTLHLRIVAQDGARLSFGRSILRTTLFPVSLVLFWLPFVRGDRLALHDLLSRSRVVELVSRKEVSDSLSAP